MRPVPELLYPDPPLTDGVITLRELRADDGPAVVAAICGSDIPHWTRIPPDYDLGLWEEWREDAAAQATLGLGIHFVIADADDRPLGSVGLNEFDDERGTGDIGYWVAPDARGRGVCSRAVRLLTRWLLEDVGLGLVEIAIHHENAASRATARKAGYVETGEYRALARMGSDEPVFVVHRFPPEPDQSAA